MPPLDATTAKWVEICDSWKNQAAASEVAWKKIAADNTTIATMEAANRARVVAQRTAAIIGKLTRREHDLELENRILKAELQQAKALHASEMRQLQNLHAAELLHSQMQVPVEVSQ